MKNIKRIRKIFFYIKYLGYHSYFLNIYYSLSLIGSGESILEYLLLAFINKIRGGTFKIFISSSFKSLTFEIYLNFICLINGAGVVVLFLSWQ